MTLASYLTQEAFLVFAAGLALGAALFGLFALLNKTTMFRRPKEASREADLRLLASTTSRQLSDVRSLLQEKELQYSFLANSIPQLVWTADLDGKLVSVNERWIEYTGLELSETLRSDDVLHPDDLEPCRERWRIAIQSGSSFEMEYRLKRRDGQYRRLLAQALPRRDSEGRIVLWYGTCTDIEETRRSIVESKSKDRHLKILIDSLPGIVSSVDSEYSYRFCNKAYEEAFGVRGKIAIGNFIGDVLRADVYLKIKNRLEVAMSGQEVRFEEKVRIMENLPERVFQIHFVPDREANGQVHGVVVLGFDISSSMLRHRETRQLEISHDTYKEDPR